MWYLLHVQTCEGRYQAPRCGTRSELGGKNSTLGEPASSTCKEQDGSRGVRPKAADDRGIGNPKET